MSLNAGSVVADVGCGDGKYFGVNPDIVMIGCDRSDTLLSVSRKESSDTTDTFCCDAVKLPFVSDMFDATLCIAVMHHISTLDRRLAIIRELLRITKPGRFSVGSPATLTVIRPQYYVVLSCCILY